MSEKPTKRPWYSFRWRILALILLPFVLVGACDWIFVWTVDRNHHAAEKK